MTWVAVVAGVEQSGSRVTVDVKMSNGTDGFLSTYTVDSRSASLIWLRAHVLATIDGFEKGGDVKLEIQPGLEIDTVPDPIKPPVEPTDEDKALAAFVALKRSYDQKARANALGLTGYEDKVVADALALVRAAFIPAYEVLL